MDKSICHNSLWLLIKIELKRAFLNRWFLLSAGIMFVLAIVSGICAVAELSGIKSMLFSSLDSKYYGSSFYSCLKAWIGLDIGQPATTLFYFLVPIAAALPYAWSISQERKTGYSSLILTRTSRSSYFVSKFCAIAATGAAVVGIPLIGNFIIAVVSLPFVNPDVTDVIYWGIYENAMLSEMFYQTPLVYVATMIVLSCLFGAVWALFVTSVSFVLPIRSASIIIPFLALFAIDYLQQTALSWLIPFSITPFEYLRGSGVAYYGNLGATCIEYAALLAISVIAFAIMSRRDVL